jgi:hypothetical protein
MRALFAKGKQREFIKKILAKISVKEAAKICKISERTIRDWRREKFLADLKSLKILCRKVKFRIPENIKLKDDYWYTANGSSAGGLAVFKKYGRIGGDPEYRKKKWYEWWEKKGKYSRHPIINVAFPINRPRKSKDLAEFVGIALGDGGITQRQVTISLCSNDERQYSKFVTKLIKKLFDVPVSIYYDKKYLVVDLVVSRSELVRFCIEKLGLKRGNKIRQQVDIPDWIKRNKLYLTACTRGLIDTDGCVFTHRYKSKGKWYSYKKLCFTSYSEPLRQSVFYILKNIGLNPRLAQRRDVRIDSIEDMQKYFQLVGSHNSKLLKRYEN